MAKIKGAEGNYVSEWFGQRIYPAVRLDAAQVTGTHASRCPFLSEVLHRSTPCVKNANSSGVCTVSSSSNGVRQDWLVCPYRVISSSIVRRTSQIIFGLSREVVPVPVVVLEDDVELQRFTESVEKSGAGYLFFQDKLGGEISMIGSTRSPEVSFDVTLVEIKRDSNGRFVVSRYGILEIQTMDYHGTYKHAVNNLRDGLRLHPSTFQKDLQANLAHWAGEGVEGPNIANVFKRTFYQMLLKFRLAGGGAAAAGSVLAIPRSVWDSWQPFLGAPELEDEGGGIKRLRAAEGAPAAELLNAFICLFDLAASSKAAISPVKIEQFIRVSPERMAHHAFSVVPQTMLAAIQREGSILARIRSRLAHWWPEMGADAPAPAKR